MLVEAGAEAFGAKLSPANAIETSAHITRFSDPSTNELSPRNDGVCRDESRSATTDWGWARRERGRVDSQLEYVLLDFGGLGDKAERLHPAPGGTPCPCPPPVPFRPGLEPAI